LVQPIPDVRSGWLRGQAKLMKTELALFWTVHSDRAVLATWGACLGLPKATLDAFGRWAATGSGEYVRTARHLIIKAQGEIGSALRRGAAGPDLVGEDELIAQVAAHYVTAGWGPQAAKEEADGLRYFGRAVCAPRAQEAPATGAEHVPAIEDSTGVDERSDDADGDFDSPSEFPTEVVVSEGAEGGTSTSLAGVGDGVALRPAAQGHEGTFDFIIATTCRSRSKCLHLAGGCYRTRSLGFRDYELVIGAPDPSAYDSVCKVCWRQAGPAGPSGAPRSASSDDEASSSSSSAPEGR
jgi:hypothetical protein